MCVWGIAAGRAYGTDGLAVGGLDGEGVGGQAEEGEDHVSWVRGLGVAEAGEDVEQRRRWRALGFLLLLLHLGCEAALVGEDLDAGQSAVQFRFEDKVVAECVVEGVGEAELRDVVIDVQKGVYSLPGQPSAVAIDENHARSEGYFLHDPDPLPYRWKAKERFELHEFDFQSTVGPPPGLPVGDSEVSLQLCDCADPVHGLEASLDARLFFRCRGAELDPKEISGAVLVYIFHLQDLVTALVQVALVDAQSVNP